MDIRLHHVIPSPIADRDTTTSAIWGKEVHIQSGACTHVYAPSGTGKTSLTHLLYGMRKDYQGQITLNGKDCKSFSLADWCTLRKNHFSIVFQDLKLLPQYTAAENIQLNAELQDVVTAEEWHSYAAALGIAQQLQQPIHQLSQGERQRVAIVRALAQSFDWLIMDEPFSHLDEANRLQAADLIQQVCNERHAGLLVLQLNEDNYFTYDQTMAL